MLYDGYRDLMDNKSDPRVKNWAMMSSPFPTLAICLSYAYFVKVLGPKLMENRKPLDLRRVMIYYNLFQVIFSTWLFHEVRCELREKRATFRKRLSDRNSLELLVVRYSRWLPAGRVIIRSVANRWTTRTILWQSEWYTVAGGTTFRNSPSSWTPSSSC